MWIYISAITIKVRRVEVYKKQLYVIKFISILRKISGFLRIPWFLPHIKLTSTILLKY